jgi:hypothetical protein
MSDTVIVCPEITITRNGPVLQVPSGFISYAWTYQGEPVGGNDPFLVTQGDGLYGVTATDVNGCVMTATYTLITTGVAAHGDAITPVLFPVPNDGSFTVMAHGLSGATADVLVLDATGRTVHSSRVPVVNSTLQATIHADLSPGPYLLRLSAGTRWGMARFMVR